MRGSSLLGLITAEALRAAIRAQGLLRESGQAALSLPRQLLADNSAQALARELQRLQGLGDLLGPISTGAEMDTRTDRMAALCAVVPETPTLLVCARKAFAQPQAQTQTQTQTQTQGAQDASTDTPLLGALLSGPARGALVAAEELSLRALEEKFRRFTEHPDRMGVDPRQGVLALLHAESASWRVLDDSHLANKLIADRAFALGYQQARKRGRGFVKDLASRGGSRLKLGELRQFERWHGAVTVQLDLLAGLHPLGAELSETHAEMQHLQTLVRDLIGVSRVRQVLRGAEQWPSELERTLEPHTAALLASLQRCYGAGKSNFQALIGSELA